MTSRVGLVSRQRRFGSASRTRSTCAKNVAVLAAVALIAVIGAAPTSAAADPTVGIDGATLTFVGDAARDDVEIESFSPGPPYIFVRSSEKPITASSPCDNPPFESGMPELDPTTARCPRDLVAAFSLSLGEGNDDFYLSPSFPPEPFEVRAGPGADDVGGGGGDDAILGEEGDDSVSGVGGSDLVDGGPGNDDVLGYGGNDRVFGGSGDDSVSGDGQGQPPGDDLIDTGDGNDHVYELQKSDYETKDTIRTGSGRDVVEADDGGGGDRINCGPGRDRAVIDPKGDKAGKSCEKVKREKD
jgi:Ca2+-binding RTX toxin-like protein